MPREEARTWRAQGNTGDPDTTSTEGGMKMEEKEGGDTENTTAEERQEEKGRRAKRRGRGGIAMETMGMEMEGGIGNGVDSIKLESECTEFVCLCLFKTAQELDEFN